MTKKTVVQDILYEALTNFGLDGQCWNKYNLIEVSLERGVAERTANPQEHMLQLVRNLRKVIYLLLKFNLLYLKFYLIV